MNRRITIVAALFCVTLLVPLSLFSQDFQMNGTVLVKYRGNAANVTIPEGVTKIADRAFSYSLRLTSVTIPSSVTSIGDRVFDGCDSLTDLTVDTRNNAYLSTEGVLFNKNRTVLVTYPVGKQERNYTIPTGVTSIWNSAFTDCGSLTNITIPTSVTFIGNSAFMRCTSLTSITIPSSVTSIGAGAFSRCRSLTGITVDVNNASYTSKEGILFNKAGTSLVQYPVGKQGTSYTIPAGVTSIGADAFGGCSSLINIIISVGVISIGNDAFGGCSSLANITIPSSVTSIGAGAFFNCGSLASVTIPSSVTSIGEMAFFRCNILITAIVSRRTSIGNQAFPIHTRIIYSD